MSLVSHLAISSETQDVLDCLALRGEDYERILRRIEPIAGNLENEDALHKWFSGNYQMLGFTGVKQENRVGCPDFVMYQGTKAWRIELEVCASSFIHHKHKAENVDLVVCMYHDRSLPVRTLALNPLGHPPKKGSRIHLRISDDLLTRIRDRHFRRKGDLAHFFTEAAEHYMKCPEVKKKVK